MDTTIALGIGAATAMFSVVRAVLIRPLTLPDPGRLAMVWERPPHSTANNVVQTQNFLDWQSRNRSFESMAAVFPIAMNVEGGAGVEGAVQVPGMRVTAGFFETLGVKPWMGRTIRSEDDRPGAPCAAALSFEFWRRRFGERAIANGDRLTIDGQSCEIAGVMPAGFGMPNYPRVDLYAPLQISPARARQEGRNYGVVGRIRRGISLAEADADIRSIASQTALERPQMNANWSATVVPLIEQTVGDVRGALIALMAGALCVLLIACANVSNLLLMRASRRRPEMAVRIALGAGRWSLFRQLMVESLLLAIAGGCAGFLLAFSGVPLLISMLPQDFPLPRREEIAVDPSMLAFTLAVSLGCGLFFGVLPALQAGGARIGEALRQGGRSGTAQRGARNLLVMAEVSLAMLLVIGAGLMLRSFALLRAVDPGYRAGRVVAFRMTLLRGASTYPKVVERRAAAAGQMIERVRAVPGVSSASSIHWLPMTGQNSGTGYWRADRPAPPPGSTPGGDVSIVSDQYFHTTGIPLLAGREFDARDTAAAPRVAILNQTAARRIFAGEDPLGKRLRVEWGLDPTTEVEVVGVSADIRRRAISETPEPCLFMPQAQQPNGYFSLLVRTTLPPAAIANAVQEQIHAVAPGQGVQDIRTLDGMIADSIARPKLDAAIMTVFGAIALTLACLGVYAVTSYSVEQRQREMGIRLALGAGPAGVLAMVLREGLLLAGLGISVGTGAALALTRYLQSLLYAAKPSDPAVFASVAAILAITGAAGCYFPARRATRVDPAVVLRQE